MREDISRRALEEVLRRRPRSGQQLGILDRRLVFERVRIEEPPAFHLVQGVGGNPPAPLVVPRWLLLREENVASSFVWCRRRTTGAAALQPDFAIEARDVDDQRISLPVTRRVSKVRRDDRLGMW